MKDLVLLSFLSSAFSNESIVLNNYDVDETALAMTVDVDFLYVGLYKKFKNLYIEVKDNSVPGAVKYEFWNGTVWTTLNVSDETSNLSRSGYVKFDLPETWVSNEVNGTTNFFIRLTGTVTVTLKGVNMVFANDADLKERYRQINDYLGSDTSFIASHQAARKEIIQNIKNSGKAKISSISGNISDLIVWDFLRPEQLREAAKFLCLSIIFAGVSDNEEGKFLQLSRTFKKEYQTALNTFLTTIDKDDDGEEDDSEANQAVRKSRIVFV